MKAVARLHNSASTSLKIKQDSDASAQELTTRACEKKRKAESNRDATSGAAGSHNAPPTFRVFTLILLFLQWITILAQYCIFKPRKDEFCSFSHLRRKHGGGVFAATIVERICPFSGTQDGIAWKRSRLMVPVIHR